MRVRGTARTLHIARMNDTLRVRLYNIRFGDAVLVTVPDNGTTRHILIDVGNVLSGKGGDDTVFQPVVEAIKAELGGKPLDLYVMTHEHMDHIQGLFFAKEKAALELDVDFAWITASAAPDYYDTHPNAKKKKLEALAAYDEIAAYSQAAPDKTLEGLMLNNNPRSTGELRHLPARASPTRPPTSTASPTWTGRIPSRRRSSRSGGPRRTRPRTTARSSRSRSASTAAPAATSRRSSTHFRPRASTPERSTTWSTRAAPACTTTCSRSTRPRTTRASSSRSSGAAGSSCSPATPSRRAGG